MRLISVGCAARQNCLNHAATGAAAPSLRHTDLPSLLLSLPPHGFVRRGALHRAAAANHAGGGGRRGLALPTKTCTHQTFPVSTKMLGKWGRTPRVGLPGPLDVEPSPPQQGLSPRSYSGPTAALSLNVSSSRSRAQHVRQGDPGRFVRVSSVHGSRTGGQGVGGPTSVSARAGPTLKGLDKGTN